MDTTKTFILELAREDEICDRTSQKVTGLAGVVQAADQANSNWGRCSLRPAYNEAGEVFAWQVLDQLGHLVGSAR